MKTFGLGYGDAKSPNHQRNVSHSSSDLHSQELVEESWSLAGTAQDSMTSIAQSRVSLVSDTPKSKVDSAQTAPRDSGRKASYELPGDTAQTTEQEISGSVDDANLNRDETAQALESMGNHDKVHAAQRPKSANSISSPYDNDIYTKVQRPRADMTLLSPSTVRELRSLLASTENTGTPEPIKFKDAVGRKFSFPFTGCRTWAVR